ncbi:MAG: C-GCAxxG-C-C family protein [Desulfoprunum sp.]|nr:C-GCAxxG-C-C family protein [Desulfoprunum sp.]
MEKQEFAVSQFMNGFRCSQAVVEAFAEETGIEPNLARKISIGLAGGAGCGGECGAVEAAYLVNSLRWGFSEPGEPEKFKKVIGKNIEFADRFRKIHNSLNCYDLIGVNLFSEEGMRQFQENELKTKICAHLVRDAVRILEDIGEEKL